MCFVQCILQCFVHSCISPRILWSIGFSKVKKHGTPHGTLKSIDSTIMLLRHSFLICASQSWLRNAAYVGKVCDITNILLRCDICSFLTHRTCSTSTSGFVNAYILYIAELTFHSLSDF